MFTLEITRKAQKSLAKIESKQRDKIIKAIYALREYPYKKAKKLQGRVWLSHSVGDYRIIYEIENERVVIIVLQIGHRREIYAKSN